MDRMLSVLCVGLVASGALGWQVDATEDPLSGPRVVEAGAATTIVRYGFDGKLERYEDGVELRVLEVLALSEDEQEAVSAVLSERRALIDRLVLEHFALVSTLGSGVAERDDPQRRRTLRELVRAFQPVLERGSLRAEIEGALEKERAKEFGRMVDAYVEAVREEERADGMKAEEREGAFAGAMRRRLEGLGVELRRSVERVIGQRADDFERLQGELGLTPEQTGRAQQIFMELNSRTEYRPSDAERREAVLAFVRILDAEQRRRFVELIRE
ncbi:MAG: hypothetical protein ACF8Q5_15160 [Phycisphaerales bacterium JB040]